MRWLRLVDKNGNLKPHTLPEELLEDVKKDIEKNHGDGRFDFVTEEVSKYSFDMGGCWIGGSPCMEIELEDLPVEVPCYQWSGLLNIVNGVGWRGTENKKFYKLHGHWTALVVSYTQRLHMLATLVTMTSEADKRDKEFMEQWKNKNATKTKS